MSSSPSQPHVAIVLLNYRGAADTIACIDSLKQLDYPNWQVIVVDNASGDGSVETIQAAHPDITLLSSPGNLGFSGGCNVGLQQILNQAQADLIWLLNNDTQVERKALYALVEMHQRYPSALIGSLVLYPDGRYQRVGNRFSPMRGHLVSYREQELHDGCQVESLTGCSILLSRQALETIGLLDEQYFLYFEDNEFCYRARQKGFTCRVALDSRVYHKEGATTGQNKPLVTYYYQRNRLRFAKQVVSPLMFKGIEAYTFYRLLRSQLKAWSKRDKLAWRHHHAFQLAVDDFYQGVFGPCPHQID